MFRLSDSKMNLEFPSGQSLVSSPGPGVVWNVHTEKQNKAMLKNKTMCHVITKSNVTRRLLLLCGLTQVHYKSMDALMNAFWAALH